VSTETKIPKLRLLTSKQLAEVTGLPLWTIHDLVKKGKGPPHIPNMGRGHRFPESGVGPWIEKLLAEQEKDAGVKHERIGETRQVSTSGSPSP
jgi:predicted DNA-binding transcriptional regulator AlpA